MTDFYCVATRHKGDGTLATHMAGALVWPTGTDPKLRSVLTAQQRQLVSVLVCASCQIALTEPKPTPLGSALRKELVPDLKALFGNDPGLDYNHVELFFIGPPADPPEKTGPPPPPQLDEEAVS